MNKNFTVREILATFKEVNNNGEIGDPRAKVYESAELGVTLADTDRLHRFYKDWRAIRPLRENTRWVIVTNDILLDFETLTYVIVQHFKRDGLPDAIMDTPFSELETYTTFTSTKRPYYHDEHTLRSIYVDVFDSNTGQHHSRLTKLEAQALLDTRPATICDLISDRYKGKVGYRGFYLRPHDSTTEFIVDIEAGLGTNIGEENGIFLVIDTIDNEGVNVFDSISSMLDWMSYTRAKIMSHADLVQYIERGSKQEPFNGFKIRRIDDIYGENIRYERLSN